MNISLTHTIPSLSGTFGIRTKLSLNPKMPKEPSSPSHANARTEIHCAKIETDKLRNNKGQLTTRGQAHLFFPNTKVNAKNPKELVLR